MSEPDDELNPLPDVRPPFEEGIRAMADGFQSLSRV
jgi:hypothetical protein